ncbi:MAG: TlpA family protein disulfide reductase [Armatimonadota bacterium]
MAFAPYNVDMRAVIASALALMAALSSAQGLGPGEPAPPLRVAEFVKGKAVTDLSKGVFVIEFWATWCSPCIQSMPHISSLAKKYEGKVTVIGVSVWEQGDDIAGLVKKFVEGQGDRMSYNVALDEGMTMAETWMKAADQRGIPATFILNDGVVQWIGHPMSMDEPLEQIVRGTFDLATAQTAFAAERARTAKFDAFMAVVKRGAELYRSGDREAGRSQIESADSGGDTELNIQRKSTLLELYIDAEPLRFRRTVNELFELGREGRTNLAFFCLNAVHAPGANKAMIGQIVARIASDTGEIDPLGLYIAGLALMECENPEGAVKALERCVKMIKEQNVSRELLAEVTESLKVARERAAASS